MGDLKDRQREMRERSSASNKSKEIIAQDNPVTQIEESSDVRVLKKQIAQLKKRVLELEAKNEQLRKQKTTIVERAAERSSEDATSEQRHNLFKYSNIRRY